MKGPFFLQSTDSGHRSQQSPVGVGVPSLTRGESKLQSCGEELSNSLPLLLASAAPFGGPLAPYLGLGAPVERQPGDAQATFLGAPFGFRLRRAPQHPVCASTCWTASWRPDPRPPRAARGTAAQVPPPPLGEGGEGEGTSEVLPARPAFPLQPGWRRRRAPRLEPTRGVGEGTARSPRPPRAPRLPAAGRVPAQAELWLRKTAARCRDPSGGGRDPRRARAGRTGEPAPRPPWARSPGPAPAAAPGTRAAPSPGFSPSPSGVGVGVGRGEGARRAASIGSFVIDPRALAADRTSRRAPRDP
jgi:hypothetical protein